MRALQWTGPETIAVNEIPVPDTGPGDLLLRVGAAGLCHSDLTMVNVPFRLREEPLTLGHEIAGTVEAIGSEVEGRTVGERGIVYLFWTCGRCRECMSGNENVCMAAGRAAFPPCPGLTLEGGMAEYVRIPASAFIPMGELDFVQGAPIADAALTSYHAIRGVRDLLYPGATAVAIGIGGLGHLAVQILKALGASRVVAVDVGPEKLDLAKACGADITLETGERTAQEILDITDGRGAETVFDFVGVAATAELATATVAPDGAYRIVGIGDGTPDMAALPWGASVRRSLGGTRRDLYDVIALARAGQLRVQTERFELTDGPEAFERLGAGRIRGRAVLVP